ncbi:MAG: hypothetical protein M1838_003961, partial [Thelocarpon superellum]
SLGSVDPAGVVHDTAANMTTNSTTTSGTLGNGTELMPNSTGYLDAIVALFDGYSCPCNCTYMSTACCPPSVLGLVYEDPSKQTGVVAVPNDYQCCNTTSGAFGNGTRVTNSTFCVADA